MSFVTQFKQEEIEEMSMIEIAFELMKENKQPMVYDSLMKKVAEIKGMTEEEVKDRTSFLYTDLNVDGRFLTLGENRWGLRSWYPFEQSEEDITTPTKSKKKKKSKDEDEDDFYDEDEALLEDDEFEDLEDELDELANDDDSEDVDDEDIDLDEDDTDFDDEEEESADEDDDLK